MSDVSRLGSSIERAAEIIRGGGVVAFPTETYYGLAVDPFNDKAVQRVFKLKKRDDDKPLLLLIHERQQLQQLVTEIPSIYTSLMDLHWPGPLTLIFPAVTNLPPLVTGFSGKIGIRISPHPLASRLVKATGAAITATSANLSGQAPAASAEEVTMAFGDGIDYILDGKESKGGLCSTIIGLTKGKLELLREGQISFTEDELRRSYQSKED